MRAADRVAGAIAAAGIARRCARQRRRWRRCDRSRAGFGPRLPPFGL